jgi:glycosyltransferase involved in cell wall biosynthesis
MPTRISVIIPVYNAETKLGGCLKSVIGQTEKSLEIICVNDGSTDGSADILARFAQSDGRIKVISTENNGAWAARNAGIDRASGDYIAFCDADDTVPTDAYRRLADAADQGFDVVVGG